MAGRMSNRDRILHLRAEADAAAKEKAAAKAAKAAEPKTRRKPSGKAPAPRVRIVWFVCDPSGREVQQFPYAQEQEAREQAQKQSTATGRTYFVKPGDVRVE